MRKASQKMAWRLPVGAPAPQSSGLPGHFWKRSLRYRPIFTPDHKFTVVRASNAAKASTPSGDQLIP